MPDAVIFDMDGVLVDSADAHLESWIRLGVLRGLDVPRDVFQETFGRPGRDIVRLMLGREVEAEEADDWVREKEEIYRGLIENRVPIFTGVERVVRDLREAGYRLAVGTSGPAENVDVVLCAAGVEDCFDVIVTGFDVERGKPRPTSSSRRPRVSRHRARARW